MLRCPALTRLKVVDLNPHLSCILCGGYFIDATTITECLHSFCRACIVRYLETSQYCPVCEVQVHKSRPLRSDKILQDIVYKLVPGLFHNEMKRRRELYASQPPEALKESRDAEDRGECLDEKFIYAPDEIFSLSIEYGKESETNDMEEDDNTPKRRFLRCPAAVTIAHLKKFIRMKYGIPNFYEVDLKYDKESLLDDYTLMDVAYIFLWQRKGPMRFLYKIVERPPKNVKTEPVVENNYTPPENVKKEPEQEVKDVAELPKTTCSPPVQTVTPQTQPLAIPKEEDKVPDIPPVSNCKSDTNTVDSLSSKILLDPSKINNPPAPLAAAASAPPPPPPPPSPQIAPTSITVTPPEEKLPQPAESVSKCETVEPKTTDCLLVPVDKKEAKPLTFKFCPGSLVKSPSAENKPAVMTVAPLTKPSSSLPTSSTTPVTGTITHGLYTGISIKKSPPNTLPPFKISSHLLPPRVPPLKLSPPRFSKLETCLRELTTSKKSSASRKSKSSKGSIDKLEQKVAQLKSASIKSVAPLVISVPHELKVENRKNVPPIVPLRQEEKKEDLAPPPKVIPEPPVKEPVSESKSSSDDDKMDLDNDLFEGRLVIAEPDIPFKDDSDSKSGDHLLKNSTKPVDSEDEEIDVLNDVDVDSGRGSDISRTEARSLCGDDDLGSPDSSVPKTPEAERHLPITIPSITFAESKHTVSKPNGIAPLPPKNALTNGNGDCGVLDLSTCGRKRIHDGDGPFNRAKQVANPAVLDKTRQTSTPCMSPNPAPTPFKVLASDMPHVGLYKSKHESSRGNFKCRGNTLTVINPDPNGNRPKIVIRNLGPRPDRGHERFHHHHHHHHQRM